MKPTIKLRYKTTVKNFKLIKEGVIKKVNSTTFRSTEMLDPRELSKQFGLPEHKVAIQYTKLW